MSAPRPSLTPSDHSEEVAIFRSQVIGTVARRELTRGELKAELRRLSHQRYRPPDADVTRTFSVPTLERWLYRYRHGGPIRQPRSGPARAATAAAPSNSRPSNVHWSSTSDASTEAHRWPSPSTCSWRTLVADGRLAHDAISPATVRRLYHEQGLDKRSLRVAAGAPGRLRWQAERPGALWHGDVCHGPAIRVAGVSRPLRIHGLLDDCSRYIIALEAHHTERSRHARPLRRRVNRHGRPDALYLDNGSTYRGHALETACARLGITLLHAQPYDPQARGPIKNVGALLADPARRLPRLPRAELGRVARRRQRAPRRVSRAPLPHSATRLATGRRLDPRRPGHARRHQRGPRMQRLDRSRGWA